MKFKSFPKSIKQIATLLVGVLLLGTSLTPSFIATDGIQPSIAASQKLAKKQKIYKSKMSDLIRLTKPKRKIPNLTANPPRITKFTAKKLKKYHLLGYRWRDKDNISYYYCNLTKAQIKLSEEEIKAINKLNIVHLVRTGTRKGANITIATEKIRDNQELGYAEGSFLREDNKGLNYFYRQNIKLEQDTIVKNYTKARYNFTFKHTLLHELGHALGLDHIKGKKNKALIMYPVDNDYALMDKHNKLIIDQEYINGLALLYNN